MEAKNRVYNRTKTQLKPEFSNNFFYENPIYDILN